eukprot:764426-Hanusia_phi.AAC.3
MNFERYTSYLSCLLGKQPQSSAVDSSQKDVEDFTEFIENCEKLKKVVSSVHCNSVVTLSDSHLRCWLHDQINLFRNGRLCPNKKRCLAEIGQLLGSKKKKKVSKPQNHNEKVCPSCERAFATRYRCSRHMKICKGPSQNLPKVKTQVIQAEEISKGKYKCPYCRGEFGIRYFKEHVTYFCPEKANYEGLQWEADAYCKSNSLFEAVQMQAARIRMQNKVRIEAAKARAADIINSAKERASKKESGKCTAV